MLKLYESKLNQESFGTFHSVNKKIAEDIPGHFSETFNAKAIFDKGI